MLTAATLYMSMALNLILGCLLWRVCRPSESLNADWKNILAQNARLSEENEILRESIEEEDDSSWGDQDSVSGESEEERWTR